MRNFCFFILIMLCSVSGFSQQRLLIPFRDSTTKKWGYIDTSGVWIIKPEFAKTTPFYKGRAVVKKTKYLFTIIDTSGKQLIPAVYDNIDELNTDVVVASKNKKRGWLHYTGKERSPFLFDWIGAYDSVKIVRVHLHGYEGFINAKGKIIIPPKFKCLSYEDLGSYDFDEEVFFICNDKKLALFDTSGKQLTKFVLGYSTSFYSLQFVAGVCPVRINEKNVFINTHGKVVSFDSLAYVKASKQMDSIRNKRNHYMGSWSNEWPRPDTAKEKVWNNYYYDHVFSKYMNKDGSLAFANTEKFKYRAGFRQGYWIVEKKDKFGLVNSRGEMVVPLLFERIDGFENGLAKVWKHNPEWKDDYYEEMNSTRPYEPNILIGYISTNGKVYLWDKP